ncbi:MAG: phosphoglycerate kinase [Myxococcota bacterium]
MQLKTIRWLNNPQLSLSGKRLLCRLDLDVPHNKEGQLGNLSGLLHNTQTLAYALQQGAFVIAAGHLGDPKAKFRQHLSLYPIANYLQQRLQCEVLFVHDSINDGARYLSKTLKQGQLLMLENLLFDRGEQNHTPTFSQKLAQLADIYVNDAFSCSRFAYASTTTTPHLLPCRLGGFALQKQLETLHILQHTAPKPVLAIVGGDQQDVNKTLPLLKYLLPYVDNLLLCGQMAHLFLSAGVTASPKPLSPPKNKQFVAAAKLWQACQQRGIAVTLPQDVMLPSPNTDKPICATVDPQTTTHQPPLDIGPQTCALFSKKIQQAATVLLLDCVGQWQKPHCGNGTAALLSSMSQGPKQRILAGNKVLQAYYQQPNSSNTLFHLLNSSQAALTTLAGNIMPGLQPLITQDNSDQSKPKFI